MYDETLSKTQQLYESNQLITRLWEKHDVDAEDSTRQSTREEPFTTTKQACSFEIDLKDNIIYMDKSKLSKPPLSRTVIDPGSSSSENSPRDLKNNHPSKPPIVLVEERPTRSPKDFVLILLEKNLYEISPNYFEHIVGKKDIIEFFQTFDDLQHCINYVQALSQEQIYLIISSRLKDQILIDYHHFPQVIRIYLFISKIIQTFSDNCSILFRDYVNNNDKAFSKDFSQLVPHYPVTEKELLTTFNIIQSSFAMYISLQSAILRLGKTTRGRVDMIDYAKFYFEAEPIKLNEIVNFDKTYELNNPINWYTQTGFLYSLLSKTCRTKNIEFMFQLRYFMQDFDQEITKSFKELVPTLAYNQYTFYRGTTMYKDELKQLESSIGKCVISNTFLSLTFNEGVANIYASVDKQPEDEKVSVLFKLEIEIAYSVPFAYAKDLSSIKHEDELILTIGAVFKIKSIEKMESHPNCWVIYMIRDRQVAEEDKQIRNSYARAQNSQANPSEITTQFRHSQRIVAILIDFLFLVSPETYLARRFKKESEILKMTPHVLDIKIRDAVWFVLLEGPPKTPYESGKFWIELKFGYDFPFHAPSARMITEIYHAGIDKNGKMCLDIISVDWSAAKYVNCIIEAIYSMLKEPLHVDYVLNEEIYCVYKNNHAQYIDHATKYTKQHATKSDFAL
ncbi:unnamed protein product [Didymodactylos carnosus]|uniref:UBC core domain-containing protein n=1 Tax=Didymodactylos carnosus TaxID=1234261 RepID=A0A8S2F0F7_9BILA|nr:unnamed protein product [Didymodactylos carnosus]CAF4156705.1 unnamed protein product [Didymodactylos carnosus]